MARRTTLDGTQLAQWFDITPRHVQRLTADGILMRARDEDGHELRGRYEVAYNVRAYVIYLRGLAKMDDASESRYAHLRNEKMAAESQLSQIRLNEAKGLIHRSSDVEFVLSNMITAIKSRLLAIPARTARLLVGLTSFQKIYELISTEIELALNELSSYSPSMFFAQNDVYLVKQGADPSTLTSSNGETDEAQEPLEETEGEEDLS
jgi:phage terminase Nu1 subunit (DNA packaging protein)